MHCSRPHLWFGGKSLMRLCPSLPFSRAECSILLLSPAKLWDKGVLYWLTPEAEQALQKAASHSAWVPLQQAPETPRTVSGFLKNTCCARNSELQEKTLQFSFFFFNYSFFCSGTPQGLTVSALLTGIHLQLHDMQHVTVARMRGRLGPAVLSGWGQRCSAAEASALPALGFHCRPYISRLFLSSYVMPWEPVPPVAGQ